MDVIKNGIKDFADHKSFWIGGSSEAPGNAAAQIAYDAYLQDYSGRFIMTFYEQ